MTAALAFVRAVSPRLAEAQLTFQQPQPIDLGRALMQHVTYCELLERHGWEVVTLPATPDLPDGVFVEDVVVIVDDVAVLTRPGAASRRPEVPTVGADIERRGFAMRTIEAPATLDGGDVLQVGDTLYVGLSSRTNPPAAEQLAAIVAPLGRRVVPVRVDGALHLKTAITALPDATLIGMPGWIDTSALTTPLLEVPEAAGADVLLLGETVVVSTAAPRTAALIRDRGFAIETLDISEFEKAEAGLTCLSILSRR